MLFTRPATSSLWWASTSSLVPHSGSDSHADSKDARRRLECELGDGGRQHLALAALQIVVVEREDVAAAADDFAQPPQIDPVEPRQIHEPMLAPLLCSTSSAASNALASSHGP